MDVTESSGAPGESTIRDKTYKYFPDVMSIKAPKADMNVQSFVKEGLIDDWNLFEKTLDYTFQKHLKCDPSNHPILFTEPVVSIIVLN
jgi:actin-related protein